MIPVERETAVGDAKPKRSRVKRILIEIAVLLVVAAVGGLVVAASGIVPIKASSGHWPITAWFLNFSMGRSVSTHTIGMEAPPLDKPWMVAKGAGHYETGCFPCHGNPELHRPRIAAAMTPHPPYLPDVMDEWDPEELFYIVKHGVKFTGMPAWPALERDDEVWAMTAFLLELPELDAQEYRRLVDGDSPGGGQVSPLERLTEPENVPPAVIENCARCHGRDGLGRGLGAFPKLAGQQVEYLELSLAAYKSGDRHSGMMEPLIAGLSADEMRELAQYYSGMDAGGTPPESGRREAIERGEEIARHGIPGQRVPACVQCHGPADQPRNPAYPILVGQYAEYLELQLELFHKQHRGGTQYAHVMQEVAAGLKPEQMRDVARYYASLRAAGESVPREE